MRIQLGKKTVEISAEETQAKIANYKEVLIDLGTGDGQFVYRWAASHPQTFCIGLDAVAENMRDASARTLKKPARGGLPNALFVVASAELLPAELSGIADVITINFPWGSLLKALISPEPEILRAIAGLAKCGAKLIILLNYTVFKDQDYVKRMGFPDLEQKTVETILKPAYSKLCIEITNYAFLNKDVPHRTSWGQHLIRGSSRETLMLEATIASPDHVDSCYGDVSGD